MDLMQLALRMSHLEQENIHLRHIQAEQSAEIRTLRQGICCTKWIHTSLYFYRAHVERIDARNPTFRDTPQSSITTDLMAYVKSIKPDHALTENERMGEDHIRRFSDYPNVCFWTESRWTKWLKEQDRDGAARVGQSAGLRGKATKSESKRRRFLEDADGQELDPDYISRMREFCRSFAKMMARRGCLPAIWKDVDLHIAELFHDALRMKFPEIQLCDGNWKANLLMSQVYYDWKRPRPAHGTKRPASPHDMATDSGELADAKFTISANRSSAPPTKIPRVASPQATSHSVISPVLPAPAFMNMTPPSPQAEQSAQQPVTAASRTEPLSPGPPSRIDKGKQRAVHSSIVCTYNISRDHSIDSEEVAMPAAVNQGTQSFGVPTDVPAASGSSSQNPVRVETRMISQSNSSAAAQDRWQAASPADTKTQPSDLATSNTSLPTDAPPRDPAYVATQSLPVPSSSTTTGLRKKSNLKAQEKPWPPAEGILQPKWTYARTWAAEHPGSTRQDFEAHYAGLSGNEKKRISRQYTQKGQKNSFKSG
ncbi:hypothetical protein PYCCODRAFT_1435177 [Trametes coccinea BRFM310]|uniref:Uncharacterized protein n=1 Tax=Trametes coccinea (strain BRFM310) TaxID=1353009 RepID=A0A1Y2IQC4_TRAC3|nr:hypothetical protein PYCCODRAFT_1435177 [Trametes coccinea BRFM310]